MHILPFQRQQLDDATGDWRTNTGDAASIRLDARRELHRDGWTDSFDMLEDLLNTKS